MSKAKICRTIFSKALGLMFHKKIKNYGLIFLYSKETRVSLHMFFVFFKIDVLYLDEKKRIIEMIRNFRPFSTYTPENKAKYIIELPEKTIEKTKTSVGDVIEF